MGYEAKVTSKGQVTLPAKLRQKLGIAPGDHVEFVEGPDGNFSLVKRTESFDDLRGILKTAEPVTAEQLDAWVREARGALGTGS